MIYGLVGWSYYVFVVRAQLNYYMHRSVPGSVILLVVYHVLFCMTLYTYTRLVLLQPGFAGDILSKVDLQPLARSPHQQVGAQTTQESSGGAESDGDAATTTGDDDATRVEQQQEGTGDQTLTARGELADEPLTQSHLDNPNARKEILPLLSVSPPTGFTVPASAIVLPIAPDGKRPRYCSVCKVVKPDRCHHCSQCDEIAGCVGFHNHKLFFLFLFYVASFTTYVAGTMAAMLGLYLEDPTVPDNLDGQWLAIIVLGALWSLMLWPFMGMHAFQIVTNQTTLEYMKRQSAQRRAKTRRREERRRALNPDRAAEAGQTPPHSPYDDEADLKNPWDLGRLRNWKAVMGKEWWLWFVPTPNSLGDGLMYPRNDIDELMRLSPPLPSANDAAA
ncbi:hypothetical protein THASP1DRAFT_27186 [Thamnocephalis sphaerospora]|uniref:Palmitoyltransferase n=1 Tax=Thamnocephalis sphaerospora TaxID=78915 RepID=A0A4P9XY47_9FUNG|nr:hypothetical protein THASP1DRAFT_27186 [Thamnocephalis sphaerospora]|eukprot:RKP11012.1 hypothetical protein THASP1DRAFT_27186 [Thamnocephalis sphaerospora]